MTRCLACGFDPTIPSPILDAHAIGVRTYLQATRRAATPRELHDELGIPLGTLRSPFFHARVAVYGVKHTRLGGKHRFSLRAVKR